MSDLEALYIFLNKEITSEMVQYLVATTSSIIQVKITENDSIEPNPLPYNSNYTNNGLQTPPQSPTENDLSTINYKIPSLYNFIKKLIQYSHIQCTTLMTTLVYLNKLKNVIPPNSIGMITTHHRIFLGSLLLAAKYTNDSSPMNKHWATYTDGLLSLREINALEMEMIQYIGWDNLRFQNYDLINSLSYFLQPIKRNLRLKSENNLQNKISKIKASNPSLNLNNNIKINTNTQNQLSASSTSSSLPSLISSSSSSSTISSIQSSLPRKDSIQSIDSISNDDTSISPKINIITSSDKINNKNNDDISLSLRPLRLKQKQNSKNSEIPNNENNNNTFINKSKRNSINLLPIKTSPTIQPLSLKHSRKSLYLSSINNNQNLSIVN